MGKDSKAIVTNNGIVIADKMVVPITICVTYSGLFFISMAIREHIDGGRYAVGYDDGLCAIGCIGP